MRSIIMSDANRKPNGKIIWKLLPVIIVVLVLLVFLLIPVVLSTPGGERFILGRINDAVPGQAGFSNLSMGWFKGVRIAGLTFEGSDGEVSVTAESVSTKPRYGALLGGNLAFGHTTIDKPRVEISMKEPRPRASTGGKSTGPAIPSQPAALALVSNLMVNDGSVKITDAQARSVELTKINSKMSLRPPGQTSNLALDMAVAGTQSTIHVAAEATPEKGKTGWSLAGTTGNLTVEVNDLALDSIEPILAMAGVELEAEGELSANLKGSVKDDKIESLTGTIDGRQIDVVIADLDGDRIRTEKLTVDVDLQQKENRLMVDKLDVQTDWANLDAKGMVPLEGVAGEAPGDYEFSGTFGCNVAALMSQMPNTLTVKEGAEVTSGRLSGELSITSVAGKRSIHGNADLSQLAGSIEGKQVALSEPVTAKVRIESTADQTSFEQFDLSSSFANIQCSGTLSSLQYSGDLDLAKFHAELGDFVETGMKRMAGRLHQEGTLASDANTMTISGSAYLEDLELMSEEDRSVAEPRTDIEYALNLDRQTDMMQIDTLETKTSFGRINVKEGRVPIGDESDSPLHLLVSVSKIDLAKTRPFAVMFASFPTDLQVAGTANGDVAVDSEKAVYTVTTDNTKIDQFRLQSPEKKPFVQDQVTLHADVQLNTQEKTYTINQLELVSPQIKVKFEPTSLQTTEGRTTLAGRADLEYDWDAVSNLASNVLPQDLQLKGKRKTSVGFRSTWPRDDKSKLLSNLNTDKCRVGFESARYMGLDFGPTDANAVVENGELTIEPFTTTVNQGRVEFGAVADFKNDPTVLKAPGNISMDGVHINETVSNQLLAYINPIFADSVNVSGRASFAAQQLSIPLNASAKEMMDIDASIAIDDLHLQPSGLLGQIFKLMGNDDPRTTLKVNPTRFTVKDGMVRYQDMQIDVGNNPVNFQGAVGLVNKQLDMEVTLPYTLGGRTIRIGKQPKARRVSLNLKGTIDQPQLDTQDLLQNQIEGLLEGLFDKL